MEKLTEEQKKRMIEAGQAALNMSHGVKNILQAVRSAEEIMDLALEKRDLKRAERTWNLLKENLDRMQKVVLDTLKFSKDEALSLHPCDFNRLVQSVVETIRPQADLRQVKLSLQLDENLESIPMDPDKMRDAVLNLLINAIEAVEPKTGRVHIQTQLDQQSKQAFLRISDNGPGIKDIAAVFEPFYSTKDNTGAGLGLTIAQNIVHQHHGKLSVQSQIGQGAIFEIFIPI